MPGQHSELLTALGIEDTGRVITIFRPATGRRHHALAFAIESDGVYRVFVAFQHNKLVAAGDIPDTSCGVPDGDRYALPVRRKTALSILPAFGLSTASSTPLCESQMRAVPSSEAVRMRVPSGL